MRHRLLWRLSLWALRGRDASGMAGRLPPGPLAASSLRDAATDEGFYRRLQGAYGSLFKIFWGSGHLRVCLVGHPLGRRLFKEHREKLEPVTEDLSALIPHNFLRGMRPEAHRRYRRLFKTAFCDELVEACDDGVRRVARDELSRLAAVANSDMPPPQGLYGTLDQISLNALLFVILGVKPGTARASELEALYRRLGPRGHVEHVAAPQADTFAAIKPVVDAMARSLHDHASAEMDDCVIRRLAHDEPASLFDDTVVGNLIYLVERGRHDLRDLLRWIVKHLSDCPDVVEALRAAPARSPEGTALARACVMETLRLEQAEAIGRRACEPFTFDGYDIPKGSWVSLLLRESHRDPEAFPDPAAYCPHRFVGRKYSSDQYSPFGIDDHQCIAGPLVIQVAASFVEELVAGYGWTVTADGPRHCGAFHWEPSPDFAIALTPHVNGVK